MGGNQRQRFFSFFHKRSGPDSFPPPPTSARRLVQPIFFFFSLFLMGYRRESTFFFSPFPVGRYQSVFPPPISFSPDTALPIMMPSGSSAGQHHPLFFFFADRWRQRTPFSPFSLPSYVADKADFCSFVEEGKRPISPSLLANESRPFFFLFPQRMPKLPSPLSLDGTKVAALPPFLLRRDQLPLPPECGADVGSLPSFVVEKRASFFFFLVV